MNTIDTVSTVPALQLVKNESSLKEPSPRIMRRVGQTEDRFTVDGKLVVRPLVLGETSIDWTPTVLPLFSFPSANPQPRAGGSWIDAGDGKAVQAGSAIAVTRTGYEGSPLGIASDMYRPVDHAATIADVETATEGRATFEGALIDGHGYHVVHGFKLNAVLPEKVAQIAAAREVTVETAEAPLVRNLPLISRLTIVHDHTGTGSLRASVVCYLGNSIVIGSACFTRRIHVGAGSLDVGVGDRARWLSVVDAMLDTAVLQHGAIGALLAKASEMPMTEEVAKIFESCGVFVARERVSAAEKKTAEERGEPTPVGAIVEKTALDVVIAYYKQRNGRLSWGVWSRRLEGDALAALEAITGTTLPAQLFRRG